jgi:hypothetical protein
MRRHDKAGIEAVPDASDSLSQECLHDSDGTLQRPRVQVAYAS